MNPTCRLEPLYNYLSFQIWYCFLFLRTFSIDNTFKKTVLENGKDQDWNIFRAHLKEMQVSRYVLEVSRYVLEVSRYVLEVCIDLHLDNLIFLDISFCGQ
jgi:hypothetical protein